LPGPSVTVDSDLPPDRIVPVGAVSVSPLPLSVAKPIDQPAPTAAGDGKVTASDAPGALNEESAVLSSIPAAV
jgi:hypothetical protein